MRRSVGCLGVGVAGIMMLGWCVGKIAETTTPPAATTAPVATPPAAPTDETIAQELETIRAALKNRRETYDSRESVLLQLALIDGYAAKVLGAEARESAAVKHLAASVKMELAAFQGREFPRLRRAWAKAAGAALWENDVTAAVRGGSAETVEFVGGLFAANANIKRTQESLQEALGRLRFKRVNYKWIPSAPKYTYYTLSTPADRVVQAP